MNNLEKEPPVFTVTQLTNAIKHSLEEMFPLIWLQGEVSNCKLHTSGHLYFSLKDNSSQIAALMFRPDVGVLKFPIKDGMQVLVRGEVNVYPQGGKYQLLVKEMKPVGLGELLLKLEELKIKLHKKGWFKSDHKKSLPKYPKKIGIVTSPTGAAIRDILNILSRRFSGFHVIINPVRVQGAGAAEEIAQAIAQFNEFQMVDVMIVGRGGGSAEDLWAFNEEIVARAIYESKIPIISAVGHETDHCIADYVADIRAPTPSAAAEIVIGEKMQHMEKLLTIRRRTQQALSQLIRKDRQRLTSIGRHPLLRTPYGILGPWHQHLDSLKQDISGIYGRLIEKKRILLESRYRQLQSLKPLTRLSHLKERVISLRKQIDASMKKNITFHQARLEKVKNILYAIDPKNLLTKGYCILFSEKEQSAITSVREMKISQEVRVLLSDGHAVSLVKEIHPNETRRE